MTKFLTDENVYFVGLDANGTDAPVYEMYQVDGLGQYRVMMGADKDGVLQDIDTQIKDKLKALKDVK